MSNNTYIIPGYITGNEIKNVRKKLKMTQKEFALFASVSKPTVERWEREEKVSGPIVSLIEILKRDLSIPEKFRIPEKKYKLRLYYMFENTVCTIIDIDEVNRSVAIKNYTSNPQFRAFGINTEPTFEDYEEFIESRCFPRSRDKIKLELERLGIPFYDPLLIIEKTEGRMAEDDFWIKTERWMNDRAIRYRYKAG